MGKKIVVPCLDVIMIAVFLRNIWWQNIPVSPKVRFCSCKDPRHLATWTRILSRKGFKVNKNTKIMKFTQIILNWKTTWQSSSSHALSDREIVTRKRKAPMDKLPVQPIKVRRRRSQILTLNSTRKLEETISIEDTPKKLSFTVYFSGKRRSLLHPNTAQRFFFIIYNLILGKR